MCSRTYLVAIISCLILFTEYGDTRHSRRRFDQYRNFDEILPVEVSDESADTEYILLNTDSMRNTESDNAGRTFHHLLLYRNLLHPHHHNDGNSYRLPYIIINNPTNLTNVNNNTVANVPAATAGTAAGGRISLKTLPYLYPARTQVFQQRENDELSSSDDDNQAIFNNIFPVTLPSLNNDSGNTNKRRRLMQRRRNNPDNKNRISSLMNFANNIRRVQFI